MLLFDEGRNEFDGLLGFFIFTFLFVNIRDCKWKVKLNNINVADLLVAFRQWFLIIFNDWFIVHLIYYTEIANFFFYIYNFPSLQLSFNGHLSASPSFFMKYQLFLVTIPTNTIPCTRSLECSLAHSLTHFDPSMTV